MQYVDDIGEIKQRFEAWWNGSNTDRPLMRIVARRNGGEVVEVPSPKTPDEIYLNAEYLVKSKVNYLKSHMLVAETFPSINVNLGAGSMALYLGCEPNFAWDTVWFKECVYDWNKFGDLNFNSKNFWWQKHLELIKTVKGMSGGDFYVNIPDIIENVDILSALRGPQNLCYDLIDEPRMIHKCINQIDDIYFNYYDAFYKIVRDSDGTSSFTAFEIIGSGKTAKVQCDFSALLSPSQFREFVLPSLKKQCQKLDHTLYHLDGPDAIRHIDAIMEIDDLNALQWTPGAGKPDGTSEIWYPIYDKVRNANKSLWISIGDGGFEQWVYGAGKLVKRYGSKGLYFLFPEMEEGQAYELLKLAESEWK